MTARAEARLARLSPAKDELVRAGAGPRVAVAGADHVSARLRHRGRRRCSGCEASILRTTRSINATWGIYVKSLETGEEIAIDADRQMETMSTIKIPLMIEVFEQIKAGKFELTDRYTFVEKDTQPAPARSSGSTPAR